MNYFVVWPDGQKFGPADLATLAQWAKEGRIDDTTDLEEESTGRRLKLAELDIHAVSWEEAAPVPKIPDAAEYEVQQAVATDRPIGETNFEIPQEYPMSAGSPYPVESYYTKGKNEVSTAWSLTIAGLVATFVLPCCCSALGFPAAMALTGVGVYYANRAERAGDPGGKGPKVFGIVVLIVQALIIAAVIAFYGYFIFGTMGGPGSRIFRP